MPILEIGERDAVKVARWIAECGGVAVWGCLDLSEPGRQWFTPALLSDGTPSRCPHWSSPPSPQWILSDPAAVVVVARREVKRLRIGVRQRYGLGLALTDASASRLRRALSDAGSGAVHAFEGNEAAILAETARIPLPEWLADHPHAKA